MYGGVLLVLIDGFNTVAKADPNNIHPVLAIGFVAIVTGLYFFFKKEQ